MFKKLINKLLCKLWLHLSDSIELEKWWRDVCMNCWRVVDTPRPISFIHDIKPLLEKAWMEGKRQRQSHSFDDLLIINYRWDLYNIQLNTCPMSNWDKFIEGIISKIVNNDRYK